ncbi:MAG: transcription termination/antitermination protein NusG [Planctomycetota bacterium]|jgi:transcriptional antiterminator NusG
MATWYALKVQPEREEKIRDLLMQRIRLKALEEEIRTILIPTESMQEIRGGKKRIVEQKTYPGYLFAEMDLTDDSWYLLTETTGVTGFVAPNPREPMPLTDEEIGKILKDIDDKKEKPKPKVEFEVGERIRIKEGPFQNYEGLVEEVFPTKGLLRVNVHIFGRSTPVELEYCQAERT